jgi:CBS domain-containing protein
MRLSKTDDPNNPFNPTERAHFVLDKRGVVAGAPPATRQSASAQMEGHRRAAAVRLNPGDVGVILLGKVLDL